MDTLDGAGGADRFFGNRGDDTLTGGTGNDTFFFRDGNDTDTITDFTAGAGSDDVIDLTGVMAVTSFMQLQGGGFLNQNGANTEIDFGGGDRIILENVILGNLHQDDFLF